MSAFTPDYSVVEFLPTNPWIISLSRGYDLTPDKLVEMALVGTLFKKEARQASAKNFPCSFGLAAAAEQDLVAAVGGKNFLAWVVRWFKTDVYSKAPLKSGLLLIGGGL